LLFPIEINTGESLPINVSKTKTARKFPHACPIKASVG
jgi:hypothetical protein